MSDKPTIRSPWRRWTFWVPTLILLRMMWGQVFAINNTYPGPAREQAAMMLLLWVAMEGALVAAVAILTRTRRVP